MDQTEISEILKNHSIDDENLASALSEIFTHLAHNRNFSEEIGDEIMSKLAKNNATRLM